MLRQPTTPAAKCPHARLSSGLFVRCFVSNTSPARDDGCGGRLGAALFRQETRDLGTSCSLRVSLSDRALRAAGKHQPSVMRRQTRLGETATAMADELIGLQRIRLSIGGGWLAQERPSRRQQPIRGVVRVEANGRRSAANPVKFLGGSQAFSTPPASFHFWQQVCSFPFFPFFLSFHSPAGPASETFCVSRALRPWPPTPHASSGAVHHFGLFCPSGSQRHGRHPPGFLILQLNRVALPLKTPAARGTAVRFCQRVGPCRLQISETAAPARRSTCLSPGCLSSVVLILHCKSSGRLLNLPIYFSY